MKTDRSGSRSPLFFFLLVFVLTIPFWFLSFMVKFKGLPDNLPVTDIGATFMPLTAACILVFKEKGIAGVKKLFRRTFDCARIRSRIWYAIILLMMPLLYLITYMMMRHIGLPVPNKWVVPLATPLLFAGFFIAATGEELGYMGYAIIPMQNRWGAFKASVIMGIFWALWHLPSMIQVGQGPALIAWGLVATVSFRVLYVWLYNNTGKSVFGVTMFHAIANTGRSIFPGGRSGFELGNAAVGYSIIIITAAIITFLWGSKTLARFRYW